MVFINMSVQSVTMCNWRHSLIYNLAPTHAIVLWLCLSGRSPPEAYGSLVCVCVCVWVCHSARYCSHFLRHRWTLRTEICNASLTQCYLEIELVNFGLEALLLSYGVICSPWRLLPAVQSPAKNKSVTTGCLSTWQFNLYNKSDGDQSEIQENETAKATQPTSAYHGPREGAARLIWHPPMPDCVVVYIAFPDTVLYVAAWLHCS